MTPEAEQLGVVQNFGERGLGRGGRQHVSLALARSGTSISMAVAVAARVHAKLFACWAALADMDDLSAWNT